MRITEGAYFSADADRRFGKRQSLEILRTTNPHDREVHILRGAQDYRPVLKLLIPYVNPKAIVPAGNYVGVGQDVGGFPFGVEYEAGPKPVVAAGYKPHQCRAHSVNNKTVVYRWRAWRCRWVRR